MKSIPKLIRRFVGIGVLSAVGLLLLNLLLLALITGKMSSNLQPWMTAEETLNHLRQTENGYVLDEEMKKELTKQEVWGIFLDNDTRKAVWSTENLPEKYSPFLHPVGNSLGLPGLYSGLSHLYRRKRKGHGGAGVPKG